MSIISLLLSNKWCNIGVVSNGITFLTNFMKISPVVKETEVVTHQGSVTSLLERTVCKKCHYMTFPF